MGSASPFAHLAGVAQSSLRRCLCLRSCPLPPFTRRQTKLDPGSSLPVAVRDSRCSRGLYQLAAVRSESKAFGRQRPGIRQSAQSGASPRRAGASAGPGLVRYLRRAHEYSLQPLASTSGSYHPITLQRRGPPNLEAETCMMDVGPHCECSDTMVQTKAIGQGRHFDEGEQIVYTSGL